MAKSITFVILESVATCMQTMWASHKLDVELNSDIVDGEILDITKLDQVCKKAATFFRCIATNENTSDDVVTYVRIHLINQATYFFMHSKTYGVRACVEAWSEDAQNITAFYGYEGNDFYEISNEEQLEKMGIA